MFCLIVGTSNIAFNTTLNSPVLMMDKGAAHLPI